jgi:hypothetical protein
VSTSNSCIKAWFSPDVTLAQLVEKTDNEKTQERVRLCYQVPEQDGGGCGRSFEDAFILANHAAFELVTADATEAYNKAKKIKKTNFAIEYGIDNTNWNVPLYIAQGLRWLAASDIQPPQRNQNNADREAA